MSKRIYVEPECVWEYFKQNEKDIDNSMVVIAENTKYGVEVYISKRGLCPELLVALDTEEIDSQVCIGEEECADIARYFYEEYLSDESAGVLLGDFEDTSPSDEAMMIDDRELEIDDAVYALLYTLLGDEGIEYGYIDDLCEDLKDRMCSFLYTDYDISIYRPMYLETEDGTNEFYEYPYPEMDSDDDTE